MPCIRCGACVDVCPADLLPQQLYWHARAKEFDKAQDYHLFSCIECGCCSYVCPSHIPLVQYYRYAKNEIWAQEKGKAKSRIGPAAASGSAGAAGAREAGARGQAAAKSATAPRCRGRKPMPTSLHRPR
jgi:Na+-translocating ferredoxin:NAD+ oxidoreductase RnfC subunit